MINSLALEITYPRLPGAAPPQDFIATATSSEIVSLYALYIFNLAIWLAGLLALGALIYAGFLYLTSTGKPERIASARNQITAAFLGILLLLSSYIVLQILNPQLTVFQIPELKQPKVIEKVDVPGLALKPLKTSIDAEIPVGRILEDRIFATTTMTRIKTNANTTLDIAGELKSSNEKLKETAKQCKCSNAQPVCGSLKTGNAVGNFPSLVNDISTLGLDVDQAANFINVAGQLAYFSPDSLSFQETMASISNLAKIVGAPEKLIKVLNTASELADLVRNPEDLGKILSEAGKIADLAGTPEKLRNILKIAEDLSRAIGNPEKIKDIILSRGGEISTIIGADKVAQAVVLAQEVAKQIEDVQDLAEIFRQAGNIAQIIKAPGDLSAVLESFSKLIKAIKYPEDAIIILERNRQIYQIPGISESEVAQIIAFGQEAAAGLIYPEPADFQAGLANILSREEQRILRDETLTTKELAKWLEWLNRVKRGFEILGRVPEQAKFSVPQNLSDALAQMKNLSQLIKTAEELGEIIETSRALPEIKATPQEISKSFEALRQLSGLINNNKALSDLLIVNVDAAQVMGTPAQLDNVFEQVIQLSEMFPVSEDVKSVIKIAQDIAKIAKNSEEFEKMLSERMAKLGVVVGGENLTKVVDIIRTINGLVENTRDLEAILGSVESLAGIVGAPQELRNVLGSIGELSRTAGNLHDLGEIMSRTGSLSDIIENPADLSRVLSRLENLGNVIGMPREFGQVLRTAQDLLNIAKNIPILTGSLGIFGSFTSTLFPSPTDLFGSLSFVQSGCISGLPCTCDPCSNVRGGLEKIVQQKNLPAVARLRTEQQKTSREIRLLREELTKLARVKNYLPNECRLWTAQSLSEFLIRVDEFESKEGKLRRINFWDDMTSVRQKDKTRDWASFYCPVGGTTFAEQPPPPALAAPKPEIPEEYTAVIKSCPQEAPVGDIIDRAERTAKLLIEKMERLIDLQGKMITAVDRMQVLISQCSSQRCRSVCIPVPKIGCIKRCEGTPCPFGEISKQVEKIAEIQEKINKLVNEAADEEIGIIPIIDKKVSSILKNWDQDVWLTFKQCVVKGGDRVLFDAQRTIGALDPRGEVIRTACESEPVFKEAQSKCYLQESQENYRQCLNRFLNEKAKQLGVQAIGWCRNRLNFFCCNVTQETIE
jgi:hypothetical protein